MTTRVGPSTVRASSAVDEPPGATSDPLARCLRAALDLADAADILGLPTEPLRAAHAAGIRRVGFPGDAYVLALVGGTGVGKSSLLNALAGGVVSAASVRRPTTAEPIAWVPRTEREALGPLLEWLGVRETREHEEMGLGPVAILDLPDMDSVATEHRARVEALLPRLDAVAWVTDPEKYADAVLHDEFFRSWLPRLARQVVLVNKSDRLAVEDAGRIQRDLEGDLRARSGAVRDREIVVLLASAAAAHGTDDLRAWLAAGVEAKSVVRGRIAATLVASARDLAREAGADVRRPSAPFLDERTRAAAIRSATTAVMRAIDLAGLEGQAIAATRAAARSRGTGPLGRLTSFVYRASGRETAVADPNRFLLRWRNRGALGPAVESIREAISGPVRNASPAIRPVLAAAVEPTSVRLGLERAVDHAIGGVGSLEPPTSGWWPVVGFLQTLATAGIALSAAWVIVWILARPVTGSVDLPVLGPVPSPFVSLVALVLAGYLLARLLGAHARWVGSRWAARVRGRVTSAVETEIRDRAFQPLDHLEDARGRLWTAVTEIEKTCASD
jgi:energy-coupling factor transporter ATP-binding protein EcfA2